MAEFVRLISVIQTSNQICNQHSNLSHTRSANQPNICEQIFGSSARGQIWIRRSRESKKNLDFVYSTSRCCEKVDRF